MVAAGGKLAESWVTTPRVTIPGIVDERRFHMSHRARASMTAADYLDYPRMAAVLTAPCTEGRCCAVGCYSQFTSGLVRDAPGEAGARATARSVFTNMGMPRHERRARCRVISQIGLVNPVAALTERLKHAVST